MKRESFTVNENFKVSPYNILVFYFILFYFSHWFKERKEERERKRKINLLLFLFIHSFVDDCMCPDRRSNLNALTN